MSEKQINAHNSKWKISSMQNFFLFSNSFATNLTKNVSDTAVFLGEKPQRLFSPLCTSSQKAELITSNYGLQKLTLATLDWTRYAIVLLASH